jgi:hypothetical protein
LLVDLLKNTDGMENSAEIKKAPRLGRFDGYAAPA